MYYNMYYKVTSIDWHLLVDVVQKVWILYSSGTGPYIHPAIHPKHPKYPWMLDIHPRHPATQILQCHLSWRWMLAWMLAI
jgi:hypothetical protein